MRIGINARTFSVNQPGGAVQSAMRLTTELVKNTDHNVILFGSSSLADKFNTQVISKGYNKRQSWGVFWERIVLPKLANQADIDVLYCPNGNAPLHTISIPVVMCIHDINAQKGLSGGVHGIYRKFSVPRSARSCNQIVTVSNFSKKEITETIDIPSDKVDVIYNGVDDTFFGDESRPVDLPTEYLLFVGSLNPRKNVEGVIRAYEKISCKRDIELVMTGPKNKPIFKSLDLNPVPGVHRYGYIDQLELKYVYEHAEALVFPSFYEGFGLPPLEAFACGTPVVASKCGALSEVLGANAVFVDPNSYSEIAKGIEEVLDSNFRDPKQLKMHAKEYTWDSVVKRLTTTFEKVT